ncbi:MAG: hypothetical protein MUD01_29240 [Chloroflexaceae bacterium]|nr:hypothetical protein [Chloroflexaceae bacterium]
MPRHKNPPSPLLGVARDYLEEHAPQLKEVPLTLRQLDGPPGSPRFVVFGDACDHKQACPLGVQPEVAEKNCPVIDCAMRHSIRLLLNREGDVVKVSEGTIHWT